MSKTNGLSQVLITPCAASDISPAQPTPPQTWLDQHRDELFARAINTVAKIESFYPEDGSRSIEALDMIADMAHILGELQIETPDRVVFNAVRIAYFEEVIHAMLRDSVRRQYKSQTLTRWRDGSEYDISAFDLVDGELAPQLEYALEHIEDVYNVYHLSEVLMVGPDLIPTSQRAGFDS